MHAVGVKRSQEYIKTGSVWAVPCRNKGMTKRREKEGSRDVMLGKPPDFIRRLSIKSEKGERGEKVVERG